MNGQAYIPTHASSSVSGLPVYPAELPRLGRSAIDPELILLAIVLFYLMVRRSTSS